jgi:hypothetical protein
LLLSPVGRCSVDRLLDGVGLANAIERFFGDLVELAKQRLGAT